VIFVVFVLNQHQFVCYSVSSFVFCVCIVCLFVVVSASAVDCLERLVVSRGELAQTDDG